MIINLIKILRTPVTKFRRVFFFEKKKISSLKKKFRLLIIIVSSDELDEGCRRNFLHLFVCGITIEYCIAVYVFISIFF